MARDFVGAWLREIKKAECEAVRAQKAAEREHKALVRQAEIALKEEERVQKQLLKACLLYTSPSPRDLSTSRMPSSA